MNLITLIAAADEKGGIGDQNQLLCHLPADLAHFKALTLNKPILMGRKTFESIGKPLPLRTNIVISQQMPSQEGILVFDDLKKAIHSFRHEPEVMVIGGSQIYKAAWSFANRIYLTRIHHEFLADVHFPAIKEDEWQCIEQSYRAADEKNKYAMTFYTYERLK